MASNINEYYQGQIAEIDSKINACIENITQFLEQLEAQGDAPVSPDESEQQKSLLHHFLVENIILCHNYPGIEAYILPHLTEIREQSEISLLTRSCKYCKFCNVSDNAEDADYDSSSVTCLWESYCYHLEKYALQQLLSYANLNKSLCDSIKKVLLKSYIFTLKGIYTPTFVWQCYQKFRVQLIDQYIQNIIEKQSFCFTCLLKLCFCCLSEDYLLVFHNEFYPVVITLGNIFHIYAEFIFNRLRDIINSFKEWEEARGQAPALLKYLCACSACKTSKFHNTCYNCYIKSEIIKETIIVFENLKRTDYGIDEFFEVYNRTKVNILLHLVDSISYFENKVNILRSKQVSAGRNLHLHNTDLLMITQEINFTLPSESPDDSPLHEKSNISEDVIELFSENWRFFFKEHGCLLLFQRTVEHSIKNLITKHTELEKEALLNNNIKTVLSDEKTEFFSSSLQLKAVLPSVFNAMKELEKYMSVLLYSSGPFSSFRASFCHTVNIHVFDLIKYIQFISRGPPKKFTVLYLYIAENTAIFLKERLNFYDDSLYSDEMKSKSQLKDICDSANKLVCDLTEESLANNMKYLSCGLLFDSQSNNFEDNKSFHEGERVSYSVQMWNLYMKSFLSEIKYYLPQETAQRLYVEVLCESLTHFVLRYAHCTPSEARTLQVQSDILTLLLCASELIYPCCNSVHEIIGKEPLEEIDDQADSFIGKIHSMCCTLLCTMSLLVSPLSEIYKTFSDGFPLSPLSLRTKYSNMSPWLPWIRTELFNYSDDGSIMSNVAVWLAVKVCTSWLHPNPVAIVTAFTEHFCTLSILLMTQATFICEENCSDSNNDASKRTWHMKSKLAKSIFHLLSCYKSNSDHLNNILMPVIERTNDWKQFDRSNLHMKFEKRPWWYQGLLHILNPFMKVVFDSFIPHLVQCQKKYCDPYVLEVWRKMSCKLFNVIDCTCEDNIAYVSPDNPNIHQTPVSVACVTTILEKVIECMITLPFPLQKCLALLGGYISNYIADAEPIQESVPLQVIISTLISYLKEPECIEELISVAISSEGKKLCLVLADLLISVSLKTHISVELSASHVLNIEKQLSCIKVYFEEIRVKKVDEKESMIVEEEEVCLVATNLLQQTSGFDTLIYLQKVLHINESWIQRSLGIPEMLSSDNVVSSISPSPLFDSGTYDVKKMREIKQSSSPPKGDSLQNEFVADSQKENEGASSAGKDFTSRNLYELQWQESTFSNTLEYKLNLNTDAVTLEYKHNFNPFEYFDKLGKCKFNEAATQVQIPWEILLSHLPLLGLTKNNFCNLLSHRWDVRNENLLSSEKKGWIQELKTKYNIDL